MDLMHLLFKIVGQDSDKALIWTRTKRTRSGNTDFKDCDDPVLCGCTVDPWGQHHQAAQHLRLCPPTGRVHCRKAIIQLQLRDQ